MVRKNADHDDTMVAASKIYNEKQKLNTSYYRISTVGKQSARKKKNDSSRHKSAQFESRRKTSQEQVVPTESLFDNLRNASQEKQDRLLNIEELHSLLENLRHQRNFYKSKYEQAVKKIIELSNGEISASQINIDHFTQSKIKEIEEISAERSPIINKQEVTNDEVNIERDENPDTSKHEETARTRNIIINEIYNQNARLKDFISKTYNMELKSRIENLIESHANKTYKKMINLPDSVQYFNHEEKIAEFKMVLETGNENINNHIMTENKSLIFEKDQLIKELKAKEQQYNTEIEKVKNQCQQ